MEKTVKEQLYAEKFRDQLEKGMQFPGEYPFKFIVRAGTDAQKQIESVFEGTNARITSTASSKGNYNSLTIVMPADSPQQILDKYNEIARIPDVIKL